MTNGEPTVKVEVADGVARVYFNRPNELNALNLDLAKELDVAVSEIVGKSAIRVIVLSGSGRAFMAGGDLSFFRDAADRPRAARSLIEAVHASIRKLAATSQIVIASLHGAIAGAGMSIALNSDFAVASSDATFNLAYLRIGGSPDCGATWTLPRLVGMRRALEIALLSETIGAEDARELGLVNRVVAPEALAAETAKLAARLAAGPSVAFGSTKHLIRNSLGQSLDKQLDLEVDYFAACAGTSDFSEGVEAFFARRKPKFG